MKRLALSLLLCLLSTLSFVRGDIYLLSGVDYETQSGFYDFNKLFDDTDDDLCWAYSASNQLQYWQDYYVSDSYLISYNIPDGHSEGNPYDSDIVYTFVTSWGNDGGFEIAGFTWWLCDTSGMANEIYTYPADSGGYYSDFFTYGDYIGEEYSFFDVEYEYDYLISLLSDCIENNYGMTLGIYIDADEDDDEDGGGAHAITLWGYSVDEENNYSLYITDSDDGEVVLLEIAIVYNEEDYVWYMNMSDYEDGDSGNNFNDWYIGDITVFTAGLIIPEPSTSILSLAGLALLALHRRRQQKN